MHEKDRRKLLEAGFTLYRCSENEKVVKVREVVGSGWKIRARLRTKKEVKEVSAALLTNSNAIQV